MSSSMIVLFFSSGNYSEEESKNFSAEMFPPGLLVVHDPAGGCQDDEAELSGGEKVVGPLFNFSNGHVKSGRDDTTLVQPAG